MKVRIAAVFATLCLLLSGCKQSVDLAAVQSLASAASTSQATFNALAADYFDSCERRNIYASIGRAVEADIPRGSPSPTSAAPNAAQRVSASWLSDTAVASLPARTLAQDVTTITPARLSLHQTILILRRTDAVSLLSPQTLVALKASLVPAKTAALIPYDCSEERKASIAWQQANGVVVGYFVALGKLAGTGSGSNTDTFGMKALATSLTPTKILTAQDAGAVGALANDVITQIYDAKRRGKLAEYIPQADDAVKGAIGVLESLATDHYAFALGQERKTADEFFERNLQLAQPGEQAFEVLSYADAWAQRTQALDTRQAAIKSYVSAWDTLEKQHESLLKAINTNDTQSALAVAEGIYTAIAPDITAIQKAYAPQPTAAPKGGKP